MMGHIFFILGGSFLIGNVFHAFINVQEGDLVLAQPWTSQLGDVEPGTSCKPKEQRQEGRARYATGKAASPPCPLALLLHATVSQQTLSTWCMLGTGCRSSECSSCSLDWGRATPPGHTHTRPSRTVPRLSP